MVKPLVKTCHICRMWQRHGSISKTSSRLTTVTFERVECDLSKIYDAWVPLSWMRRRAGLRLANVATMLATQTTY